MGNQPITEQKQETKTTRCTRLIEISFAVFGGAYLFDEKYYLFINPDVRNTNGTLREGGRAILTFDA